MPGHFFTKSTFHAIHFLLLSIRSERKEVYPMFNDSINYLLNKRSYQNVQKLHYIFMTNFFRYKKSCTQLCTRGHERVKKSMLLF